MVSPLTPSLAATNKATQAKDGGGNDTAHANSQSMLNASADAADGESGKKKGEQGQAVAQP